MRKILLVEDDIMSRDLLARRLRSRGFEVVIAGDGERALELARESGPNLIVMDMSLPVKDGWNTVRELKSRDGTKHIPIIALTGYNRIGDREQALQAGCTEFESKPVSFKRLIAKIGDILGFPE
ncbi:MAG: response regulator [Gammaproteobacteria bacterium]|nr:response regulator [Gammaproteobacteria bacterium]NIR84560.1 response regulator [Gammaproteobacteria bacterium]NIR90463.1 response regulator [Gammaproteobacteria bacterium]NIU05611.1 response regulator [Gammaproteobacteria bacterium]NIV52750.1 response regulator [Gammaproteobacteria bacterium]